MATIPRNLRKCGPLAAVAVLAFVAGPASANDRLETHESKPATLDSKVHTLVLYTDARLAFYASESPSTGTGCREHSSSNEAAARAKKDSAT
jgi:hypothetical protein